MTDAHIETPPTRPIEFARRYIHRGWAPVPIPRGRKGPIEDGWQNLTITAENVAEHFNGTAMNIGVQMGPKSGGLTDVDLDCAEAVQIAPHFLPPTGAVFGRATKPRSHYLYTSQDAEDVSAIQHRDQNGAMIVELRVGASKGVQTMFPGSKHPDTGETVEWNVEGDPATTLFATFKHAVRMIAVASLLTRHWPSASGSRHDLAMRVGGSLARAGLTDEDIDKIVAAVTAEARDEEANDRRSAAAAAASAYRTGDANAYGFPALREALGGSVVAALSKMLGAPPDDRPLIAIKADNLPTITTQAEDVLIEADVPLYQRGGELVRPVIEEVDASEGRLTKIVRFVRINETYLRDLLGIEARWRKFNARGDAVPTNAPSDVAKTLLAREGQWEFPPVSGVISTPTMRADGTILSAEGYDKKTRLLLVARPAMPPIAERPTKDDAVAALAVISDLLTEFPLVGPVSRAVALSALITPVVRAAFAVAPMHSARAPTAGSGKSYLFDCAAAISIGQPMPVMAAGRTEEETEKRLGANLLTGQPLICIDNVNGELKGDALCQAVERPIVEVRILGKSERVRIEARGVSMYSTGNNIILVGDLCRRVITAVLDAQMERPELRAFRGNPVAKILADRGKYVAAALTICRAYAIAGRPDKKTPLASFGGWSDTVRSALMWLGEADPVELDRGVARRRPRIGGIARDARRVV